MVKYVLRREGVMAPPIPKEEETRGRARRMALMSVLGIRHLDIAEHFGISQARVGQVIHSNKAARAYLAMLKNRNADKLAEYERASNPAE